MEIKKKKSFDKHGFCSLAVVSWERGIVRVAGGDSRWAPCPGSFLITAPEADAVTSSCLLHSLGVECQEFPGLAQWALKPFLVQRLYPGFLYYMIALLSHTPYPWDEPLSLPDAPRGFSAH